MSDYSRSDALPRFLSARRSAALLGVSINTLKAWVRTAELPAHHTPGGHLRIAEADVFALRARLAVCPGPKASGGPRILLVDDNKRLLEVLHEALAGAVPGALIDVATDGYEALMQVGRFPPDLLVLDLRMPRLDGFEVCQRLKSRANTRMIRILAITAYPEGGARERILAAGADGFLEKPLDMREFRATALALLGREAVTGGLAVPTEDSA